MKRNINWPLVGLFVVAAALPVGAFVYEYVFSRCTAAVLAEIGKDKPNFGCFEFFFNRYQSFAAGVIAFIGAYLTVSIIRKQMRAGEERAAKIARMRALAQLNKFYGETLDIFYDCTARGTPLFTQHWRLPTLDFNKKPDLLADLDPLTGQVLFIIADAVDLDNDEIRTAVDWLDDDVTDFLVKVSAEKCEMAHDEINALREALGWPLVRNVMRGAAGYEAAVEEARAMREERLREHPDYPAA